MVRTTCSPSGWQKAPAIPHMSGSRGAGGSGAVAAVGGEWLGVREHDHPRLRRHRATEQAVVDPKVRSSLMWPAERALDARPRDGSHGPPSRLVVQEAD